MIFGQCHETSFSAITLNPESSFTRREKNHSLFHWNTLTYPELLIQTWMSGLNAASTTIGTSMYQEICLLLDRFHPVYSFRRETSRRIYVVHRRLTRRQLTSRPDHLWQELWEKMGKKCQAEGQAKVVTWKTTTRQCQKIKRNLFYWPWWQGIQRDHQECSQEIGNTSGIRYALQDKQEYSKLGDSW